MLVLVTIVVIAYFYYHVTAFLEPDWRALYSAPGHGPYTHLTRPLLAFCARGDWLARDYEVVSRELNLWVWPCFFVFVLK